MNRRKMIKSLALSTGIFAIPGLHIYFTEDKPLYLVNIGSFWYQCLEEFCNMDLGIKCISIGWDKDWHYNLNIKNNKIIDFDVSAIDVENHSEANKSFIVPQRILDIFKPGNKYLLVTDLRRPNTILTKGIMHWLKSQEIKFQFLGTTALLHSSLRRWAKSALSEFDNDRSVYIFDTEHFLQKLQMQEPDILVTHAIEKLDHKISDYLYNSYVRIKVHS